MELQEKINKILKDIEKAKNNKDYRHVIQLYNELDKLINFFDITYECDKIMKELVMNKYPKRIKLLSMLVRLIKFILPRKSYLQFNMLLEIDATEEHKKPVKFKIK